VTNAGGSSPLFNQIFKGLNVSGVGVVDGSTITVATPVRRNTTLNAFLLATMPAVWRVFGVQHLITGTRGGLLKNAGPANFIDANPQSAWRDDPQHRQLDASRASNRGQ